MIFRTKVDIPQAPFSIEPMERMLFVGSCFADNMGKRFQEEQFQTVINPYGVMYNPASILHTVEQFFTVSPSLDSEEKKETQPFTVAVLTLGTNHVYIEKATGKIVDNCQKRPQKLFDERELSVEECADLLRKTIRLLREKNPKIHIILTVSPIRYAKYGYHESQLSKATLLLSIEHVIGEVPQSPLMEEQQGNFAIFPPMNLFSTSCATTVSTNPTCFTLPLRRWTIFTSVLLKPSSAKLPIALSVSGNPSRRLLPIGLSILIRMNIKTL